jgi:hypothetical protein
VVYLHLMGGVGPLIVGRTWIKRVVDSLSDRCLHIVFVRGCDNVGMVQAWTGLQCHTVFDRSMRQSNLFPSVHSKNTLQ